MANATTRRDSDLDAQSPAADLVRVYLNGIGKTALLNAADEVELAKRIEAGLYAQHLLDTRKRLGENRKRELAIVVRDGALSEGRVLRAAFRSERPGRLARADHGTILLDEVSALTPSLQAKLLSVLLEGEFEPLGSSIVDPVITHIPQHIVGAKVRARRDDQNGERRVHERLEMLEPVHVLDLRARDEEIRHRLLDRGQRVESGLINPDDGVGPNIPNLPPDHITVESIPF